MSSIVMVAYRSDWPSDYQKLSHPIRAVSPSGSMLHHIGSTAIPGMTAKNIIDIQLSVDNLDDLDISAMHNLGWEHVPDRADHCPPGLKLTPSELDKRFFKSTDRPAHLHVRQRGRFNQRYALLCRDFLRSNANAAAAYETVKLELAARFPDDVASYYAIKDPVFDLIMAGAQIWAETSGWVEPEGD